MTPLERRYGIGRSVQGSLDFSMNDEQESAAALSSQILSGWVTHREPGGTSASEWSDELWKALVSADLPGLAIPCELGGSGLSILETAAVAIEFGRIGLAQPVANAIATVSCLGRSGDQSLVEWSRRMLDGAALVLTDLGGLAGGAGQRLRVDAQGRVTGSLIAVPDGARADRLVAVAELGVPGSEHGDRLVAVLIDPHADGVDALNTITSDGYAVTSFQLDGVVLEDVLIPSVGAGLYAALRRESLILSAAESLGLAQEATRLTAEHLTERHQFGRPLATFQSVSHRLADCYIDIQAMTVTMWQAAFETVTFAESELTNESVEIATIWACEGLQRVMTSAQHLHGGMGADVEYPLQHLFRLAKRMQLLLGDASAHLSVLGRQFSDGNSGAIR